MQDSGKSSAVARWAARGKDYIVMLRPVEGGLVMQQLLYSDEIRPISEIEIEKGDVSEAELKLARQLIDQISSEEFDPTAYHDEAKQRIEAAEPGDAVRVSGALTTIWK